MIILYLVNIMMQGIVRNFMVKSIDFSKFTSIKIGPVKDVEILDENSEFDGVVIGGGNNILMSDNPPKLGILDKKFNFIKIENNFLVIGGACKSGVIYNFCKKNNIGGFEFLKNIPGTLGGLVTMNAGVKEFEICNKIVSIKTNLKEISKQEANFSYRKSSIEGIILEAKFEINEKFDEILSEKINSKRSNQPKGYSFGSCFKNPNGYYAGKLIEDVGLKGVKIGNVGFSEMHANFLINYGGGKFSDAVFLIELAKKEVFEKFGVELKSEVVIL